MNTTLNLWSTPFSVLISFPHDKVTVGLCAAGQVTWAEIISCVSPGWFDCILHWNIILTKILCLTEVMKQTLTYVRSPAQHQCKCSTEHFTCRWNQDFICFCSFKSPNYGLSFIWTHLTCQSYDSWGQRVIQNACCFLKGFNSDH